MVCAVIGTSCKKEPKPGKEEVTRLEVTPPQLVLAVNETAKLTYTVEPSTALVSFSSENAQVASVSADGTVTALSKGVTKIIATAGNKSASVSVEIRVSQAVATTLKLAYKSKAVIVGDTFTLPVAIEPADAAYTVTCSNPSFVEINGSQIKVLTVGEEELTVRSGGQTASFKLQVLPEESYDKTGWIGDIYTGDPRAWSMAQVVALERDRGLRECIGYDESTVFFGPKPDIDATERLFDSASYFLQAEDWSRVVYNCTIYPVTGKDGAKLTKLTQENHQDWLALFFIRYPQLNYIMEMREPDTKEFYGLLFARTPPLNEASLSLMVPNNEELNVTHFVVCTYPLED